MKYRSAPTVAAPPVPPNFAQHFIEGGWRKVERVYGCKTSLMMAWIAMSGGLDHLQQKRREYLRDRAAEARRTMTAVLRRSAGA